MSRLAALHTRLRRSQTALQQRVSLHAAVTLALSIVPVILFGKLATDIVEAETIGFDRRMLEAIHTLSSPGADVFWRTVTQLGGTVFVPCLTAAIVAWCWRAGYRNHGLFLACGVGGASVLNLVLKTVFSRARPDLWQHLVHEQSYSFPSGHAVASMALAAALVVLCWHTRWWPVALVAGGIYVCLIGWSRMYLGVHYPTDILGGWLVAIGWIEVVRLVFKTSPRRLTPKP